MVLSFERIHVETKENMTKEFLILIYSKRYVTDRVINKVWETQNVQ